MLFIENNEANFCHFLSKIRKVGCIQNLISQKQVWDTPIFLCIFEMSTKFGLRKWWLKTFLWLFSMVGSLLNFHNRGFNKKKIISVL